MLENTPNDLKTRAYVLMRTNYGEADRILNLITPVGKISAMAKGVRKPKSKLAGGVEMFTLTEVNLHFGRGNLATLTGAKMLKFHSEILKDFNKMEMAAAVLKKINKASEHLDNSKHFEIVDECLEALNMGFEINLVEAWFLFNLIKSVGEQVNLATDTDGENLREGAGYEWDFLEKAFKKNPGVDDSTNLIKILRLMWAADLKTVGRVKGVQEYIPKILEIGKAF